MMQFKSPLAPALLAITLCGACDAVDDFLATRRGDAAAPRLALGGSAEHPQVAPVPQRPERSPRRAEVVATGQSQINAPVTPHSGPIPNIPPMMGGHRPIPPMVGNGNAVNGNFPPNPMLHRPAPAFASPNGGRPLPGTSPMPGRFQPQNNPPPDGNTQAGDQPPMPDPATIPHPPGSPLRQMPRIAHMRPLQPAPSAPAEGGEGEAPAPAEGEGQ